MNKKSVTTPVMPTLDPSVESLARSFAAVSALRQCVKELLQTLDLIVDFIAQATDPEATEAAWDLLRGWQENVQKLIALADKPNRELTLDIKKKSLD